MSEIVVYSEQTFEGIRHTNEYGEEFWYARELQKVLEYSEWRNFLNTIEKAKTACENSGNNILNHFVDVNKMVGIGSGAERKIGRELKKHSTSKSEFIFRRNSDGKIVYFEANWMETVYATYPCSFSEHILYIDDSNVTVTSVEDDKILITINCSGHTDSIFSGKEVKINWGISGYSSNTTKVAKTEINSDGSFEYQETRTFIHNPASSLWYVPTYNIYGASISNGNETLSSS